MVLLMASLAASRGAPLTTTQRSHSDEYEKFAPLFFELADLTLATVRRKRLRNCLITAHLPLAEHIARRFRERGQPAEDVVQVANLGLINAVDRFDPYRGANFLAFAVPTITGEILRYLRDTTWAVRVPRRLKELRVSLNTATSLLGQELGRVPRPAELAAELGRPIEEIREAIRVGRARSSECLDDHGDDYLHSVHLGVTDGDLAIVEDREALAPALGALPEREATIVLMRFFSDMTQSQIAERFGLSQMHISRLLAASLEALRQAIAGEEEGINPRCHADAPPPVRRPTRS